MGEKKELKVRFSTVVYLFIILVLVVTLGVVYYLGFVKDNNAKNMIANGEVTEKNNISVNQQVPETNNNVEEKTETNNTEEEVEEKGTFIDYSKDTTVVEDGNSEKIKGENTLKYSLLREHDYTHEFYEKYCSIYGAEGDSAAWEEIESNYETLYRGGPIKVGKYTETIECDIAVLNERIQFSADYKDTMILKDKAKTMWDAIKNDDFYKDDKYKLNGISIMNGNNNSEEDYNNNARAKKIKVTVNNDKSYTFELKDTNKPQLFDIGIEQEDISKVMNVTIEVLETYKGLVSNEVYINEVGIGISTGGLGAR